MLIKEKFYTLKGRERFLYLAEEFCYDVIDCYTDTCYNEDGYVVDAYIVIYDNKVI